MFTTNEAFYPLPGDDAEAIAGVDTADDAGETEIEEEELSDDDIDSDDVDSDGDDDDDELA